MDNAGWHALKRAQQEVGVAQHFCTDLSHSLFGFVQQDAPTPSRGPDGQYRPVAQVGPMEDTFIGGWTMPVPRQPSPRPTMPEGNGDGGVQMGIPAPSPLSQHLLQTGYPFVRPPSVPPALQGVHPSLQDPLAKLSPVERSHNLHLRKTTMSPNLQFMCGPLLRYDAVDEHGVWNGAALIVSKCSWFSLLASGPALTTTPSPSRGMGEFHSQLQTLGRRTNRIRVSSTAGIPNILLRTRGNTVLKAHKASTWARTQPTLMLCLLGVKQTSRGPMY
jgi:hypothetical protein